ncbi:Cilia- and flagella-associated protein 36 [Aphelenchoides bicaudatus]|nr:Cilia- and flagella-associated protein 36 [Aphelenchoides bicaudatus]
MNMLRRRSSSTPKKASPKVIFKKFMEFLQTDVWRLPTMNYLEKNSILFNREQANHDLCVTAHQQYTELVDTLIESYCLDANISTKDLVEALKLTDQSTRLSEKEKHLLEPVVAAQDFNVFVPLMTRINIELQLQAVKMLEHICGVQPVSFKFSDDEMELWQSLFDEDETERYIIISVLKQSKEEFEQDEKLRKALQDAFQSSIEEIQHLENRRAREIELLDNAISGTAQLTLQSLGDAGSSATTPSAQSPAPETSKLPEARPKTPTRADPSKRRASAKPEQLQRKQMGAVKPPFKSQKSQPMESEKSPNQQAVFDFRNLLEKREGMSEELLKQRAEYLRQQRDKLVEAKHKQREKQLIEAAQKNATERPRTSQAARGAMRGEIRVNQQQTADLLEARRAIANRIREQVMGAGERSESKS